MSVTEKIQIGMGTEHSIVVGRDLTIAHWNDTFPAVFSTPSMIKNMELACSRTLAPHLPKGWTSVGVAVDVRHLAATPIGLEVRFTSSVKEVGDDRVVFSLEAHHPVEKIGEGTITAAPVELDRFLQQVRKKTA